MITKNLYLFGDSICFGQLVGSHKSWASQLCKELDLNYSGNINFCVQNAGVNGNTTRQALERLHYDVISHKPDFVLIQFGMNDCNYWVSDNGQPRVSKGAFLHNILEISHKCISSGVQALILSTNHFSSKGILKICDKEISYDQSNRDYNNLTREAYKTIASEFPTLLLDNELFWQNKLQSENNSDLTQLLLSDGIHLSVNGHSIYAEYVIPEVQSFLNNNL